MKLRNKDNGRIVDFDMIQSDKYCSSLPLELAVVVDGVTVYKSYRNFAELFDEWEEVKDYWFISDMGQVHKFGEYFGEVVVDEKREAIGNLFDTEEEAEQAVEKLKAWKRLKDKGVYLKRSHLIPSGQPILKIECDKSSASCPMDYAKETWNDLDLLFGGEE